MTAARFDPFRAEQAMRWRNRVAAWRGQPAQSLFHGLALLALAGLLSSLLWRGLQALAPDLRDALVHWPLPLAVAWTGVLAARQAQGLQQLLHMQAREWLAAVPVASWCRARRRRDLVLRAAFGPALGGAVVLLAIDSSVSMLGAHLGCVALAALIAMKLPLPKRNAATRANDRSLLRDAGAGRFWRWQWLECGIALRGRTLAWGLWALLLVPMGAAAAVALAMAVLGLGLAVSLGAWRRSLAVLVHAQAWLGPQPLSGSALLRACGVVPMLQLAVASGLVFAAFFALGTPAIALPAAAALLMGGSLHFATTAAWRATPARIVLQFALHLLLLLALLQAFPPLVLPAWLVQLGLLWRRSTRA